MRWNLPYKMVLKILYLIVLFVIISRQTENKPRLIDSDPLPDRLPLYHAALHE